MKHYNVDGHTEVFAAAFAAHLPEEQREQIYQNIHDLGAGRRMPSPAYVPRDYRTSFVDWWRTEGENPGVPARVALQQNFDQSFKPVVQSVRQNIQNAEGAVDELPGYLNSTITTHTFTHSIPGGEYIIRVPQDPLYYSHNPGPAVEIAVVEEHVDGLWRGLGHTSLEQIVGFSYKERAVVSRRLPGALLTSMDNFESVSDAQVNHLLDTFDELELYGIAGDYTAESVMYDPSNGFSLLNYSSQIMKAQNPMSIQEKADEFSMRSTELAPTLAMSGLCGQISYVARNRAS